MAIKVPKRKKIKKSDKPRRLLIDADIVVFQCVSQHIQEVQVNEDEWTYNLNMKRVREEISTRIEEYMMFLKADEVFLAFGSRSNWRKRILSTYKLNRIGRRKPLGYRAAVEWCESKWTSKRIPWLEADDVLGIYATSPSANDKFDQVIVSEDKDLKTIPGQHWNPRHGEEGIKTITKNQADVNHLIQTLCGDTADGFAGCKGVGPVKAENALIKAGDDSVARWKAVVDLFEKTSVPEKGAVVQARVARILRCKEYNTKTGVLSLWTPPDTDRRVTLVGPRRHGSKR